MTKTHTPPTAEVPSDNLPAVNEPQGGELALYDFGDDVGAGLENMTRDEYSIPFFRILQTNSPEAAPAKMGGIASPGQIMNSATKAVFDELTALFVYRDHNYLEAIPRDAGGGVVGIRPIDDPLVLRLKAEQGPFKKLITPEGTELSETFYLYALITGGEQNFHGLFAFSSMQIKKYKMIVNAAKDFTYPTKSGPVVPPLWAHRWRMGTQPESNKKGDFFGWDVGLINPPPYRNSLVKMSEPDYAAAAEFYKLLSEGKVKADLAQAAAAEDKAMDDIPF